MPVDVTDVTDVTALINHILGTATYPIELCDLNADGIVDVTDVTTIITTILKYPPHHQQQQLPYAIALGHAYSE